MEKLTIYLDCDDTILYSSEAVIRILNKKYGTNKTIDDLKDWGYRSIASQVTKDEVMDIYASDEFWKEAEFNEDFVRAYKQLKKVFVWKIASKGTATNLQKKKKWLKKKFGRKLKLDYLEEINQGVIDAMTKHHIDMTGGIQIDDNMTCLKNSSAAIKVLFQSRMFTWNQPLPQEDNLYVVHNWDELKDLLVFFNNHREFVKREYD